MGRSGILSHVTQFWGGFATYMDKNTRNKTMVDYSQGKITSLKKDATRRKITRTDTSTNDVSQSLPIHESDIFLTTFVPEERTQDESKEVEHQG